MSVAQTTGGDFDGLEAAAQRELGKVVHNNTLASYAIGLLVTVVVLLLAVLVAGEFAEAIPEDGAFGDVIGEMTGHVETAFTIFGVAILVIPAVAAVVLIVRGFGGMVGGMGR